jgi:Domain of unknown function (DUF4335)
MTIRRQYSLPNCSLILDGLGSFNTATSANTRPLMSTLVNAECHLVGQEQSISGGLEFLKQLIATVSNYTQRFLSSFTHPHLVEQDGSIRLEKGDLEHQHRLVNQNGSNQTIWQFSTVQLFDLVEAIDQFLADGMTLPDLSVAIRPTPKGSNKQLVTQAAPIGLGLSGLAATALAFSLIPTPKSVVLPTTTPTPQIKPAAAPQASPVSNKPATKPTPTTNDKINNNATQVDFIQRKLRREINQDWIDRKGINSKLEYRITVDPGGTILNYEAANLSADGKQNLTPLPKIVPSPGKSAAKNLTEYKVGFTPNGALEIAPFYLLNNKATLGQAITDPTKIQGLVADISNKVQLQKKPTFKQNIAYRVAADESGSIVDYEPVNKAENQAAFDYEHETPLPTVTKYDAQAAAGQKPISHYLVVYQPNGLAKVSPWK